MATEKVSKKERKGEAFNLDLGLMFFGGIFLLHALSGAPVPVLFGPGGFGEATLLTISFELVVGLGFFLWGLSLTPIRLVARIPVGEKTKNVLTVSILIASFLLFFACLWQPYPFVKGFLKVLTFLGIH